MDSPKTRTEMVGEALREVGVLTTVFIPVDYAFADPPSMPLWVAVVASVVFGIGPWLTGMLIEERRR